MPSRATCSAVRPTDVVSIFAPALTAAGVEWVVSGGVAADARADVYLAGNDILARQGLATKRVVELVGLEVPIASPEQIILQKLRFRPSGASERHLRDIRGILRVMAGAIDIAAL